MDSKIESDVEVTETVLPNGDIHATHTAAIPIEKLSAVLDQEPYGLVAFTVKDDSDWKIEPAPVQRDWMEAANGFAYRCLPLTIANAAGWVIRSPVAFTAIWNGGPATSDVSIFMEDPLGKHRNSIKSHFGSGIITIQIPWLFQTQKERLSLTVRGLPNYFKRNVHPCEGRVEIDWLPFTFTMNWKIMEPNVPIAFAKGDPVCFIEPCQLDYVEAASPSISPLADYPQLEADYNEWNTSRTRFNARPDRTLKEWEKHYHNGIVKEDGTTIEPPAHHRTSIKPQKFERR
jgi:hypothetical protein